MRNSRRSSSGLGNLKSALRFLTAKRNRFVHLLFWREKDATLLTASGKLTDIPVHSIDAASRWKHIAECIKAGPSVLPVAVFLDQPFSTHLTKMGSPPEIEEWLRTTRALPASDVDWKVSSRSSKNMVVMTIAGYHKSYIKEQTTNANAAGILVHSFTSLRAAIVSNYQKQLLSDSKKTIKRITILGHSYEINLQANCDVLCEDVTLKDDQVASHYSIDPLKPLPSSLHATDKGKETRQLTSLRETGQKFLQYGSWCLALGVIFFLVGVSIPQRSDSTEFLNAARTADSLTRELAVLQAIHPLSQVETRRVSTASIIGALSQEKTNGMLLSQISVAYKNEGTPQISILGSVDNLQGVETFLAAHRRFMPEEMHLRVEQFTPLSGQSSGKGFRFVASSESNTQ